MIEINLTFRRKDANKHNNRTPKNFPIHQPIYTEANKNLSYQLTLRLLAAKPTLQTVTTSAWLAADSEMKGWRFYLIWLLVNEDRSCLVTGRVSLVQPLYKQTLSSRRFPERAVQEHLSSQTYMPNTRRYTNICIWPQWLDVLQGSSQCLAGVHHLSVLRAADVLTPKLCPREETQNSKEQKGGSKHHSVLREIRKTELK